jgi:N-acetylneuraminate synthase
MTQLEQVLIIAEAGVNHNGSIVTAKKLVDVAAEAGADICKFQTFVPENVISRFATKAEYQQKTTGAEESQLDMVRKLRLSDADHFELERQCRSRNIEFLSTGFDLESVDFLRRNFSLRRNKIPSGEITNLPLVLRVASTGIPIVLSTGMATLADIEEALAVIALGYLAPDERRPTRAHWRAAFASDSGQRLLRERVTLLHCTTEYPAQVRDVNLRAMHSMREAFGLPVGLSDHSDGIAMPLAAVALGATVIEKHFTLDRSAEGPDHAASLAPHELAAMVRGIRDVSAAMGDGRKVPAPSEVRNAAIARKSLVARQAIRVGEPYTEENLTAKRPGTGIDASRYWELLGRVATRGYQVDELICE